KWHNGTSSRTRSTKTSDGLAAIQAQLNNLGREIKKVNEKVYAAQVGCELCKGPHYTKDYPQKEEGKTLEEAYYTQFGVPYQPGGQYRAPGPRFYQRNNENSSYPARRDTMEESLSKFMDDDVPLILGRPFLSTAYVKIDVYKRKVTLKVGDEKLEEGIDYDEVFAPVARIEAIRLFLAFACYMGFLVYQMDVKSAFLYERIDKEVYVTQPKGFVDPQHPKKVYKARCDEFEALIKGEFQMSAMGELTFFLGSVRKATTPYEAIKPKSKNESDSPSVLVSWHQVTPTTSNLEAVKKIFKYLKGQPKLGLWYPKESPLVLKSYSDSDYARENKDRKSTTGGCQFLGRRPIFHRFSKTDSIKAAPPPLSRDYTSLSDHTDLDESQMSYGTKSSTSYDPKYVPNDFFSCDNSDKSSEVNTNDFASSDSSVKSSEHKPVDSTSCASTSSKQMANKTVGIRVGHVYNRNKVNYQNQFIPQAVLLRIGKVYIPTVKPQPVPTGKPKVTPVPTGTSKVTPVPTGTPKVTPVPTSKLKVTPVPTGKPQVSTPVPTGRPNRPFPVPTDRGYSPSKNPFLATEDEGIFDSGCSRSMTGNKERLDNFQAFQGGKVTFGGGEGRITGKGTIHTECLVLSKDFKLPDDSMVVLKVPRKHNLYTINLNDLYPSGNLACLVAHTSFDESVKWHRRMGHVNYKNMNRLVKGNLVRENQLNKKVKAIRCDNGTEFKNAHILKLYGSKRIKREYSNPRTPQQNKVAERKNKTLIEAAQTMLADSKLPNMFWTEAVRTACYVLNRVSVTSPHNQTPYALLTKNILSVSHFNPFGCHVTILNISDHLGKFDVKPDEGYIVGYSASNKAYRVYNVTNKRVEESMNIRILEEKPNVQGLGHEWLHDADSDSDCDEQVIIIPSYPSHNIQRSEPNDTSGEEVDSPFHSADENFQTELARLKGQEHRVPTGSIPLLVDATMVPTDGVLVHTSSSNDLMFDGEPTTRFSCPSDLENHDPSPGIFSSSSYDDAFGAALNNVASTVEVSPVTTKRINTIHPQSLIIGDPTSAVQTRSKALEDPSWVDAMQEEMQQFKFQNVWVFVDLPEGKYVIGTKWILKNKRDARGIVVRNKARLVAQGHRQEEGIDYDEAFLMTTTTPYEAPKPKSKNESDSPINASSHTWHQVTPTTSNLEVVKKIFKYLKGQPKLGLWYPKESPLVLKAYSNSDYAGANKDRKSTTSRCQFLGRRLISWQCKKQTIMATSSTEAEYVAGANCCG
nr:putative ribonuclease H-like domain-containing protein [Tanacetum cinerariifolium]